MHSLSTADLDCHTLDLVLLFCVDEPDLEALGAPAVAHGWVPRDVLGRNWLHRAAHREPAVARALGDRLDLRWADWVGCVRGARRHELAGSVARASRCAPHAGLLWALATDPRPPVRTQGILLAKAWLNRARTFAPSAASSSDSSQPGSDRTERCA